MGAGLVSCSDVRALRAAVLLMRTVDKDIRRDITRRQRETMNPVWQKAVAERAPADFGGRVLMAGVRIASGNPPSLVAASSRRRVGGRLIPADSWAGFEYGANREAVSTYKRRSRGGGTHEVTRRTQRHLRKRDRWGYVLDPASNDVLRRMTSLIIQCTVRAYMNAIEGRS